MAQADQRFGLYTYEDWARGASKRPRHDLAPLSVPTSTGAQLRIEPDLVEHRGVTVVGHDWIPILADGRATLDRMVHTPELYFDKMRNVEIDGDKFRMKVRRTTLCARDAILIGGSRNYYHWLVNHLPRLQWMRELGLLQGRVVLVNDRLAPFQQEALAMMKLSPSQCIEVGDDEAVVCHKLLVPTLLARATVVHPHVTGLLKRALPPLQRGQVKRVYIRRGEAGPLRIVNEAELEERLRSLGFEVVELEGMTQQARVDLFSGAELVVGAHGEDLTNIVFCAAGARVVEIYSPLHKVTSMQFLSNLRRHRHVMLPAENVSLGADGNPLLGDWRVDVASVEAAVLAAPEAQPAER